jgi:hypothetical protein
VNVCSDEDQKSFTIHRDLLVRHSEFFEAALRGEWREARNRTVDLQESSPQHFEVFYNFLYNGCIFTSKDGDFTPHKPGSFTGSDAEWLRLGESWALGQKILSTSFKDAVTDATLTKISESGRYPLAIFSDVYHAGSGKSGLGRVLVDVAAWKWRREHFEHEASTARTSWNNFLVDVTLALKARVDSPTTKSPLYTEDLCAYHDHVTEGKPCWRTMF